MAVPWTDLIKWTPSSSGTPSQELTVEEGFLQPMGCVDIELASPHPTTACRPGCSSGLEVLRRMCLHLDHSVGIATTTAALKLTNALDRRLPKQFTSAVPNPSIPRLWGPDQVHWIDTAFSTVFCLWPVVGRSTVNLAIDRMLNSNILPSDTSNDSQALVYAVLALGEKFDSDVEDRGGWNLAKGQRG